MIKIIDEKNIWSKILMKKKKMKKKKWEKIDIFTNIILVLLVLSIFATPEVAENKSLLAYWAGFVIVSMGLLLFLKIRKNTLQHQDKEYMLEETEKQFRKAEKEYLMYKEAVEKLKG